MSFCRAGDLADAHFLCTVGGAGGAEVHEIDAGDQEDEHSNDGEDVNELDIAVSFELVGLIGMEMDVCEGSDGAPEVISCFLEAGQRRMDHFLEGLADIEVYDCIYILLDLGSRGAGLGKDIGIIITAKPGIVFGIIKGVGFAEGANEAEMKMGLSWHVPDDPGDLEGCIIITYLQCAADDVGAVEIAAGGTFIDYDGMRVVEGGIGIAGDHGQGEDLEDRRVGEGEAMVEDVVVTLPDQQVTRVAESDHLLDLRIGSDEGRAEKFGDGGGFEAGVIEVDILIDPIDAVGVDIVAVVTELIGDVQDDQQADTEADSEADDVEGSKALAFPEAAEGDLEIVAEHGLVGFMTSKAVKSFAAEGFYGVSEGRADGLNTDRQQGNGEGDGAGHEEDPPADLRTIGKRLEPFVHGPPRDGEGDERSDPDKDREVLAEQTDDAGDPGAKDLADPDLLGALFGSIGNEAEKPKAGNEDGEDGEGDEDLAGLLLGVIQFIKVVIHEGIAEGQSLFSGMEVTFHLLDEAEGIIRVKADGHAAPVRVDIQDEGLDPLVHGIIVEIFYDADDMKGDRLVLIIPIVEDQIERVLNAEHPYGGFIEEDGGGVGRKLREVEVAAFDDLHAEGGNIMVVDIERGHEDRLPGVERGIPEPAWLPILVAADGGDVAGDGCVGDPGKGEQVLAKLGRAIPAERPGIMDDEYLIPVKADFLIADIVQLAVDDEGADDEANRNKKLKDHQAATEPAALEACGHLPFQYMNRPKGGKVECGITAGETADEQHEKDEEGQEPAAEEHVGMERFAGKLIEHR